MKLYTLTLIDGGMTSAATKIQNHINYLGANEIEMAIVSHADSDHVGGIIELINRGQPINTVILPKIEIQDNLTTSLIKLCEETNINVLFAGKGFNIQIDGLELNVIAPLKEVLTDKNDCSIVLELCYNNLNMLYTGDISQKVEYTLQEYLTDIDILKVGHHGSQSATSEQFLLKTTPEYGIISCGINNSYKHPHQITLDTLQEANTEIFRTDLHGAIKITLNKDKIVVSSHIQEEYNE